MLYTVHLQVTHSSTLDVIFNRNYPILKVHMVLEFAKHFMFLSFFSNEYMSIVTVVIAFFAPVSVMIGLYLRVWWETVKRQRELVHLQGPQKKVSSKRSDSR